MPITEILERNCKLYGDEICLVELNPEIRETHRKTWKEFNLIEPSTYEPYRREITWNVFNELLGMAAHLFWCFEDRRAGSSHEFPIFG